VDGGPCERVSWMMGTEEDPVVCLRVEGVDEEEGMKRSSFDWEISIKAECRS